MTEKESDIRKELSQKLLDEKSFWSFDHPKLEQFDDRILIVKTLVHLDLAKIDSLFEVSSFEKIKRVWQDELAISGEYYHTLNRFLAWWCFKIKNPDRYLKWVKTRHINSFG